MQAMACMRTVGCGGAPESFTGHWSTGATRRRSLRGRTEVRLLPRNNLARLKQIMGRVMTVVAVSSSAILAGNSCVGQPP